MERNNGPRKIVEDLASRVLPLDEKEQRHQADILTWVRSGAQLFRTVPPTTPPQHLAVYFALFDEPHRALMLVDHVKAGGVLLETDFVQAFGAETASRRECIDRWPWEEDCVKVPGFGGSVAWLRCGSGRRSGLGKN